MGEAAPRQISGTRIAHAELNALAQLSPGDYSGFAMLSTFEPCLMCTAASRHSHLGLLRFAASDPLWKDLPQLPGSVPHAGRHWPDRRLERFGWVSEWACLLPLLFSAERSPSGTVMEVHEAVHPDVSDLARDIVGRDEHISWRERGLRFAVGRVQGSLASIS